MKLRAVWAAFFLFAGTGVSGAAEKAIFLLDWIPYGKHAPYYCALDKGFYREAAIDVAIERGRGSADNLKRLGARAADFVKVDMGAAIVARSRGVPARVVGILADKSLAVVFVLKGSGMQNPRDLEGRRIGDEVGSGTYAIFPAFAKINGIKKWEFVPMTAAAKNSSLITGKVDAITTMYTVVPALEKGARQAGKEIQSFRYGDWGLDTYAHALVTLDSTLRDRADTVRRFVRATYRGIAWAFGHPEEAVDIFLRHKPTASRDVTRQELQIAIDHLLTPETRKRGVGLVDQEKMRKTIDTFSRYMKLERKVSAQEMYTNEFMPRDLFH